MPPQGRPCPRLDARRANRRFEWARIGSAGTLWRRSSDSRRARFANAESSLYGRAVFAKGGGVSDIIREVDEELRRERFEKLWRKYGTYALGLAALVVLAVAGYIQWQHYTAGQREERARQYEAAIQLAAAADPGAQSA